MEIHDTGFQARQIFQSNILLIICCVFYLAWWVLAFKPTGAIKGIKTGWLLIPAFIAGMSAIALAVNGIMSEAADVVLVSGKLLLWGGIAAYLVLLVITRLFLNRQVTTELFLIIGWAVLELSEINVFYGMGRFSYGWSIFFMVIVGAATLISFVCYVQYYNLGICTGYVDGMIPLVVVALVMAGLSVAMAYQLHR